MAALDPAVAAARAAVRDALADLEPGSRVVVAVSGGADSLALAAATAFVVRDAGLDVEALVVDHGLQPGSAQVAARAADQVRGLGLPARVVEVQVGTSGGPEAAARAARHAALVAPADGAKVDAVLLGHTLDDQAETVLLGLGRGSGPRSLGGMRPVAGVLRRPLLGLTRAQAQQVCRAHDLVWWDDPHNADPAFRRVRVRREALPLLEDVLDGGVAAALARTADQLRADADLLDRLAREAATLEVDGLAALHPALRSRVLRLAAIDAGAAADELSAHHVAQLDALVTAWRGQTRIELPGGISAVRADGRLAFGPTPR